MKADKRRCQRSSSIVPTSPSGRYYFTSIVSDEPEQVAEASERGVMYIRLRPMVALGQSPRRLTSLFLPVARAESEPQQDVVL
jgi:hypothetical protein